MRYSTGSGRRTSGCTPTMATATMPGGTGTRPSSTSSSPSICCRNGNQIATALDAAEQGLCVGYAPVAVDRDDARVVDEAIDEGDGAAGVGEDSRPITEQQVRAGRAACRGRPARARARAGRRRGPPRRSGSLPDRALCRGRCRGGADGRAAVASRDAGRRCYKLSARHSATRADWLTPFFSALALTRSTIDSGRWAPGLQ